MPRRQRKLDADRYEPSGELTRLLGYAQQSTPSGREDDHALARERWRLVYQGLREFGAARSSDQAAAAEAQLRQLLECLVRDAHPEALHNQT
jgi:hypothetical protein